MIQTEDLIGEYQCLLAAEQYLLGLRLELLRKSVANDNELLITKERLQALRNILLVYGVDAALLASAISEVKKSKRVDKAA